MRRPAGKIFYGWYIVLLAFLGSFWGPGAVHFALGVVLAPLAADLHVPRTSVVLGATIASIAAGAMSPVVGRFVDRRGARLPMVASGAVAGAALIALAWVQDLWVFLLLYGVVLGATRPGLAFVAPMAAIANWFVRKRGRALSLGVIGPPTAAVLVVPASQWVIDHYGWPMVWGLLGAGTWLFLVVPPALIMRRRPEDMGLLPDGDLPDVRGGDPGPPGSQTYRHREEVSWKARDAFRTPTFWLLGTGFAAAGLASSGLLLHMFPYFTEVGLGTAAASGALSAFGAGVIGSRLLFWGWLMERMPIRWTLIIWAIIMTSAVLGMMFVNSTVVAYAAAVGLGLSQGGFAPLQALVWPHYYGRTAVATITGVSQLFFAVSNALGPLVASLGFDMTGSYSGALAVYAAFCALGVGAMFLAREPGRRPEGAATS